jgi:hypothetical protein
MASFFSCTVTQDDKTFKSVFYAGDFDYSDTVVCSNGETYYKGCSLSLIEKKGW